MFIFESPEASCGRQPRSMSSARLAVNRLEQAPQELVDGLLVDPAQHDDEVVIRIDDDDVGAVSDVGEDTRRSMREQLAAAVVVPVHEAVTRIGGRWRE